MSHLQALISRTIVHIVLPTRETSPTPQIRTIADTKTAVNIVPGVSGGFS